MPTFRNEKKSSFADKIVIPEEARHHEVIPISSSAASAYETEFVWSVTNFDIGTFRGRRKSPLFKMTTKNSLQCRLVLYKDVPSVIFVKAEFLGRIDDSAEVRMKLFFLNRNGQPFETRMYVYCSDNSTPPRLTQPICNQFRNNALVDRGLRIFCGVKIVIPETPVMNYTHLFEKDIVVQVGELEFPAHRCVLAHLSPVFANMFKNNTTENQENVVTITDFDAEAVKGLLDFVYTGRLENEVVFELFQLANKYMMEELIEECSDRICKNITVDNAAEVLVLADLYCDLEMKDKAKEFILHWKSDVRKTEGYKKLALPLLMEILEMKE